MVGEDQWLVLVPILIRCDPTTTTSNAPTGGDVALHGGEVLEKKLAGDSPVTCSAGQAVPFKKLKATVTSHQLDDALLAVRFELRKYWRSGAGDDQEQHYEVVTVAHTRPINMVSHSSQVKRGRMEDAENRRRAQQGHCKVIEVVPAKGVYHACWYDPLGVTTFVPLFLQQTVFHL